MWNARYNFESTVHLYVTCINISLSDNDSDCEFDISITIILRLSNVYIPIPDTSVAYDRAQCSVKLGH